MEKFLWTNKLIFIYSIFRSNNISQNFVLLTLHGKFIFNRCMLIMRIIFALDNQDSFH